MTLSAEAAFRKDVRHANRVRLEHRHYAVIAGVIASIASVELRNATASLFANQLHGTNPHFNRTRFLRAAGFDFSFTDWAPIAHSL